MVVEELEGGDVAPHRAVVMTPAEARHYANPKAVERLDQALESAQAGKSRSYQLRSNQE